MAEVQETLQRDAVKSFVAWGSIAYGLGFVTVMLHTARLGFPVLELLSAIYIWVGAPLAVVAFFSQRIWQFFWSRASRITNEVKGSWDGLKQGVPREDFDLISSFLGISMAISPILRPLRRPLEWLLKKSISTDLKVSKRATAFLTRFAALLRGIQAINAGLNLGLAVVLLLLAIGLYVWQLYPLIPQSYGGGAPTEVRLLVNTARVPRDILGLPAGEDGAPATAITERMNLLYSTADNYYIEVSSGRRISLSRGTVEGVIWNPENAD